MNLRDLRYLVAVADHRHFGRAADACFVSQPTLSTQIKKLERELGVELVERTPRQVSLTPVGEEVVARARAVLREADGIEEVARRHHDLERGTLRLGLFPTLAPYLLPHVVPALHRRFPHLSLLLDQEKTEVLLGRLHNGGLARPVAAEHLEAVDLFIEDFVLAVPVEHPLAPASGPLDVSVLADQPVLLLEEGHCLRDQALSVCHTVGATEHEDSRATSLETLRHMVAAGVGVTLLPELAVRPPVPSSPDIRLLRFAEPVPRRRIAMFWRRNSPLRDLLPRVAMVLRTLPDGYVTPPGDAPSLTRIRGRGIVRPPDPSTTLRRSDDRAWLQRHQGPAAGPAVAH